MNNEHASVRKFYYPLAIVLMVALFATTVTSSSAQTLADIKLRDQLIADQKNLLNAYRCLFDLDTDIVPGGCKDGVQVGPRITPGAFAGTPTQQDLKLRDNLIAEQERLLNIYRCRFGIDIEVVKGGCVDGVPALLPTDTDEPTDKPTDEVAATPTATPAQVATQQPAQPNPIPRISLPITPIQQPPPSKPRPQPTPTATATATPQPTQRPVQPVNNDPVVSITAQQNSITEGDNAVFTVSASPVPSAALTVTVNVTASGSFGVTTGSRTVTIPTAGSATLTVATSGDTVAEPNGSVTVSVTDGASYDVSSSAGTATVSVADDDVPVVSIAKQQNSITEGDNAVFTLRATPVPSAALTVNVSVSTAGNFGITSGSQTVVIPVSGTATLTLTTTNDSEDEATGSVSVIVRTGTGYNRSSTSNTANIIINDDDDKATPSYTTTLVDGTVASVVTMSSGSNTGDLEFTASLDPAPSANFIMYFSWTSTGCQRKGPLTNGIRTLSTVASSDIGSVDIAPTGSGTIIISRLISSGNCEVTVTLDSESTYTKHSSRGSATASVSQTPVVSITAGTTSITEGADAVFTVAANPAPSAPLTVWMEIEGDRKFGITPYGFRTVTIPVSGTATLTIATNDDQKNESDGEVTVTLGDDGESYTLSATATERTATIAVADND